MDAQEGSLIRESTTPAIDRRARDEAILREVLAALPSKGRQALTRAYPRLTIRSLVRMESIALPWFGIGCQIQLRAALHPYGLRLGMREPEIVHVLG